MRYGPNPEQLAAIAKACGCEVGSTHELPDGELAYQMGCRSHAAKVQLLAELAEYDSRTPEVRRAAEMIAAGAGSAIEQIERLHCYVRDRVTFTREPVETFSPTMHVLDVRMGDCDDTARALIALLRSLGHEAGVMTLGKPPRHAGAGVRLGGRWYWLETTIAAHAGEHPIDAAARLGIKLRPDLTG